MHSVIEEKLKALAISENIHFLWVVESGSRAWGFASPDSDYDVRGIYIRPPDEYLKIEKPKDTFEWIENHWFDIGAWDLQKSLRLLWKSNAALLEWTHSPIVYLQDTTFIDEWRWLLSDVIQAAPLLHHYRGIAKHSLYGLTLEEPIRLKK
ncbi:Predicted nucleotidyltransferase [Suttonella ornithocola]|uniref:Predicted nucleotidyltransferase n=1 Tax=Suttonella ornithocola TaxID=279832 RepID=A0A380MUC3_9GAMM|nr:Predicted nucleotidyltransferase [Suttonella ornithocola]